MEYTTLGKTGLRFPVWDLAESPIQRIDAEGTKKLMQQLAEEGVTLSIQPEATRSAEESLGYALQGMR